MTGVSELLKRTARFIDACHVQRLKELTVSKDGKREKEKLSR